jgi:hypothetical protein
MLRWLDTETQAMLGRTMPDKLAPPDTETFSLVLLEQGADLDSVKRALAKVPGVSAEKALSLMEQSCPLPIAKGLSITDAVLGQFELVCSDCVSVFLNDDVVSSGGFYYLTELYGQLRYSPEFEMVDVRIAAVPETDVGQRFVEQFLGGVAAASLRGTGVEVYQGTMMRKKARIMAHWAKKIGAEVQVADDA